MIRSLLRDAFKTLFWVAAAVILVGAGVHILEFLAWAAVSLFPVALAFVCGCLIVIALFAVLTP